MDVHICSMRPYYRNVAGIFLRICWGKNGNIKSEMKKQKKPLDGELREVIFFAAGIWRDKNCREARSYLFWPTGCAIPHFATYRVRYKIKIARKSFAILSLQASRIEKYCCWASPCRKRSLAKGVWQKSADKSDRSIRKSDQKSGKKKAHKHKSFWPVTPPVTGGSPDREARGQSFMCYPRNPRNINLFVRIPDREDR